MMFTQRRRARHPSMTVEDHAVDVTHAEHGSWASCACSWSGPIRLDVDEANVDAGVHMARVLSRRLVASLADTLTDAELLELLSGKRLGGDGELAAIVDLCHHVQASGW